MAQSHTTNNLVQTKVNTLETILTLIDNLRAEVHSLVDDVCAIEGNNKEGAQRMVEKHLAQSKLLMRSLGVNYHKYQSLGVPKEPLTSIKPRIAVSAISQLQSEARNASKKRDFVKSCLERHSTSDTYKRPRLMNTSVLGAKMTKQDLELWLKKANESTTLQITPLGSSATIDGLKVGAKLFNASILFKTPIIESRPNPVILARVNLLGKEEKVSLWTPSCHLAFKKLTNNLATKIAEMRIKFPEKQLEHFLLELSRTNVYAALDSV